MTSSPDKQVRPRNKFRELFRDRVLADVPGGGGGGGGGGGAPSLSNFPEGCI
jgi:hypothetical protein